MTASDHQKPHGDLIEMYLDHLKILRRSPDTIRTYRAILDYAHRHLPYGLPSAADTELIRFVASANTANTQRMRTIVTGQFFDWAVKHQHLDWSPAAELPRPTVPDKLAAPATDEQVARILAGTSGQIYLWSVVAAYVGARAIEISRLHREHIGEQHVRLFGKGNKERLVPTHELVAKAAADLPAGPITRYTSQQLRDRARYRYTALGVVIGIHRLRAWFGTTMLQSGADLATVQDLMGHANPKTTRAYATPSGRQFTSAVASLPALGATVDAAAAGRG